MNLILLKIAIFLAIFSVIGPFSIAISIGLISALALLKMNPLSDIFKYVESSRLISLLFLFNGGHFSWEVWVVSILTGTFCLAVDVIFCKLRNTVILILGPPSIISIFILLLVDTHKEAMHEIFNISFFLAFVGFPTFLNWYIAHYLVDRVYSIRNSRNMNDGVQ
jgi:hypothetical protein